MSKVGLVARPKPKSFLHVFLTLLPLLAQRSNMRMLIRFQIGQESADGNSSVLLKLLKSMIDGCVSFLSHIVSYVINKLTIGNTSAWREGVLDSPYLLGGKEDARRIEEEIESMFGEGSLVTGVVFVILCVEMEEVLVIPAE
jgi:hypothetical protein